jgi:energy-coupling factor transporter transmembrane protein EcfT
LLVLLMAAGVASGQPAHLALAVVVLGVLLALHRDVRPRSLWRAALRLRLFYVSIGVLYLWFTPGQPLLPAAGSWSPTLEGAVQGGERVAVLLLIIAAVHWLMASTSQESLLAGLRQVFAPLGLLGFPVDRLVLRLVLTMRLVPRLQELATHSRERLKGQPPVKRVAGVAAEMMAVTVREADTAPCPRLSIPATATPPVRDWLALAALAVAFLLV